MMNQNRCKKWWVTMVDYFNAIAGVPNYPRYLEHFNQHHLGETPLSEKEFHHQSVDEKYSKSNIRRCC
jgi:uncharacterized short protein YbdD (DUF466 family)